MSDAETQYIEELQWAVMRLAAVQMGRLDFYISALELTQNAAVFPSVLPGVAVKGYLHAAQNFEFMADCVAEYDFLSQDHLAQGLFCYKAAVWWRAAAEREAEYALREMYQEQVRLLAERSYNTFEAVPVYLEVSLTETVRYGLE